MKKRSTQVIISGKKVLPEIPRVLRTLWPGKSVVVISDGNTRKAAGSDVARIVDESGIRRLGEYIFPAAPRIHADTARIADLVRALARYPDAVPIAVGSGTLNDIVKRAAEETGRAYLCVPTAPSVDGYTSFGAAITVRGFKTTLPCAAPAAIVADEDVMSAAPQELLSAGYGDLAAKLASGRDWLVARELGLESIDPDIWALSQASLAARLSCPEKLAARDPVAVRGVFDGLCDTGLAMQDQGDSRPASGAEHHISHCWEMRGLAVKGVEVLHGQKVAAGTLLSTAAGEILFSRSREAVRLLADRAPEVSPAAREAEVRAIYAGTGVPGSAVADIVRVSLEKLVTGTRRTERLSLIVDRWDAMRSFAFADRPTYDELARMFQSAGCPSFADIGIHRDLASWGMSAAQTIRNRYTVFDLAYELGVFPDIIRIVIDRLF